MNTQIYDENFKLWSQKYPSTAPDISDANITFSQQQDQSDLQKEASEWFQKLNLRNIDVLYIYGLELEYYFEVAKNWLKTDNHYLIFFENDPAVIRLFLHSSRASELLSNPKVCILYFKECSPDNPEWQGIFKSYGNKPYLVTSSMRYEKSQALTLMQLHSIIGFWSYFFEASYNERISLGYAFFKNYYQNLQMLPNAYQAKELFGKFKGTPAIICGAGPSLEKNLSLLESLSEHALIFAGGSSMNAVNANGFIPHFGVGIDPNPAQITRLFMNEAYEVPFLYRNRMQTEALQIVQGPKLYVTGTTGYSISEWIEKQLGIYDKHVDEGLNVVNFSLSLACEMGCNPIIFVGLDLAYTDKKSYHSGVLSHPLHSRKQFFTTKRNEEELLTVEDIFGVPILTQWKWISESLWLSHFTNNQTHTLFINATEGGIGIPNVPNKPLHEVKEYLLTKHFALKERVHAEIQAAQMPSSVNQENIKKLLEELKTSLTQCAQILQQLMENPTRELEEQLHSEVAYKYILKNLNEYFAPATIDLKTIDANFFLKDKQNAKSEEDEKKRLQLLYDASMVNKILIEEVAFLDPQPQEATTAPISIEEMDNENEPENIQKECILYPDGKVKFEQSVLDGKLHGRVTSFKEDGTILASSRFVRGLRHGKTRLYYFSGKLYGVESYVDGVRHGMQLYYYENGFPKTFLPYEKGQLHGKVQMNFPTGLPKRELNFQDGKRDGTEKMWDKTGKLIVEAHYCNGRPVNYAKMWHPNGQLAQEAIFNEDGKLTQLIRWNELGEKIRESEGDYFEQVSKRLQELTVSLETVCSALNDVATTLGISQETQLSIAQDLQQLGSALQVLHGLNQELLKEVDLEGNEEAIWKTPTIRRELESQIDAITIKLSQELQRIQKMVIEVRAKKSNP